MQKLGIFHAPSQELEHERIARLTAIQKNGVAPAVSEGSAGPSDLVSKPCAIDFREALQRSLIEAADPLSDATNLGLVTRYQSRRAELPLDPGLVPIAITAIDREFVRWEQRERIERALILALLATVIVGGGVLLWWVAP